MGLDPRDFPVQEHALGNGLQVRLLPDRGLPIATLYSFFRVGSRNERPGITGISHLFEHMMFNGSKKYGPKEFDRRLESAGGTSNAYTSTDVTAYYEDFASEALPLVLDLESDRMASLIIDDDSLQRERKVVKEERRFRTDNDLDGMMDEALSALAFQAHPYRWPVVGWMSDLNRITRQDCERYFRTYYAPNNCTLLLVGDFDPADALKRIDKLYGAIRDGEPSQKGERRAVIHYPAQAPALLAGFRTPNGRQPDSLVLDLIEASLSYGEGARLADEPMREAELQRAKNFVRSGLLRGLQTANGRAHTLGQMEVMLGSWRAFLDLPDRYQAVTPHDVQRVARATFAPHRRNLVTLVPGELPEGVPA